MLIPIFWEGEHVTFAGCTGHVLDIGGAFPGLTRDVVDVWAEGKLIDSAKIYQQGELNEPLYQHIFDNVRTPEMNRGDVEAMVACCRLGERRFGELLSRYGLDTVMSAADAWMDYSESMLRREIEKVPDGIYRAPVGWLDDDGKNYGIPLKICLAVHVEGLERITIDPHRLERPGGDGLQRAVRGIGAADRELRRAHALPRRAALRGVHPPERGAPSGRSASSRRSGRSTTPSSRRRASPASRQINRIPDLMNLALAEVVPELVVAGSSAAVHSLVYSGYLPEERQYWVYIEVNEGSYGGRFGKDGLDAVDCLMANTRNNPIEELELRQPMLCERYELREEPPAPGRWRGGIGPIRQWRLLTETFVGSEGDQRSDPPRGISGGHDGLPGSLVLNPGPGETVLPSKVTNKRFGSGDVIRITIPSGGGYGDPHLRDPAAVLDDVLDGFVPLTEAREHYGVVIDADTLVLDLEATRALREERLG